MIKNFINALKVALSFIGIIGGILITYLNQPLIAIGVAWISYLAYPSIKGFIKELIG